MRRQKNISITTCSAQKKQRDATKETDKVNCDSLKINVWKIPMGVSRALWIDGIIDIYCRSYGLLGMGRKMIAQAVYQVYENAGVMDINTQQAEWKQKIHDTSGQVSFAKIYQRFKQDYNAISAQRAGDAIKKGYERILERLSCFSRSDSIASQLYGSEDGLCIDELIETNDDFIEIDVSSEANSALKAGNTLNSLHKEMKNYTNFIEKEMYDFACSCIVFGCIVRPCYEYPVEYKDLFWDSEDHFVVFECIK